MEITKILWASDGSRESDEAFKMAIYLAETFGAEILCLFVNEVHIPVTHLYPSYEEVILGATEKTESRFRNMFEELGKKNPGIEFSSKIVRENIVDGIIKSAREESADLIVMGKKGHGLIGSALLGSNTLKVLRNSPVPVLSLKLEEGRQSYRVGRILVPVDISDTAESALWSALGLAEKTGASITAVYVFWINGNIYDLSPSLVDELIDHSAAELKSRVRQVKEDYGRAHNKTPESDIKTEVLSGVSPGVTITNYAADNNFDLIAVSTHGRKGFERLILGSETEKVIREARCPVLALKP
ncbi:MAG: universal stress protein [Deltaproteobacteria bacterium]